MKIGLFDGIFSKSGQKTINCPGWIPSHFEWAKDEWHDANVFTELHLDLAHDERANGKVKIAWILEPCCFSGTAYEKLLGGELKQFDWILSHDQSFVDTIGYKAIWAPLGGVWVERPLVGQLTPTKTKLLSMMTTDKNKTTGHYLRHVVQKEMEEPHKYLCDLFGRGSNPIQSKLDALRDYAYSIVIESCRTPGYFSEKLLDAFFCMTIPIYWGAPDIARYFDPRGMLICESEGDIYKAMSKISLNDYYRLESIAAANLERAEKYACAEDYAYVSYPWIFGDK